MMEKRNVVEVGRTTCALCGSPSVCIVEGSPRCVLHNYTGPLDRVLKQAGEDPLTVLAHSKQELH